MKEIIELKAFGHLNGTILSIVKDGYVHVPTTFRGKEYVFIYKLTGNVRKLRPVEDREQDSYAHEAVLEEMRVR